MLPKLPTRGRVLEFWHSRVRRAPWLFRDKYGITYQFRPGDSFAEYYDKRATLDDAAQLAYLERTITPGMTVLDVGANIGGASLLAARMMRSEGRLLAFEADPDTYATLRKNFELNHLPATFEALNCAVAATSGQVTLHRFPQFASSWNSIARYDAHGITPESSVEVVSVDLDTVFRQHGLEVIDLLKVDVEGAEPEVFAGARQCLERGVVRRVLFEISRVPLVGSNHSTSDVVGPLLTAGYTLYAINPDGHLGPVTVEALDATTFGNFVAVAST